ncbi:MBL fold metallo-hydrolase, partial [bacterium]
LIKSLPAQGMIFGLGVSPAPAPDVEFKDGDEVEFGSLKAKIIHTPGHSPGSVSVKVENHLFTGDLLFAGSIGRTDLKGGDYDTLIRSVKNKVFTLPEETVVHPGHGPDTSIGREKRLNPFFR